jgi:type II secretory ATPase GspE/PulE/Tfp pilus assembly ATPase PilB-like protein
VAVMSPVNDKTVQALALLESKGFQVTPVVTSIASLEKAWARYSDLSFATETKAGALDISSEDIKKYLDEIHSMADVRARLDEILKLKKGFRISKILEVVLSGALATKASDVHV